MVAMGATIILANNDLHGEEQPMHIDSGIEKADTDAFSSVPWRAHGLFAVYVAMALTAVVLATLVLASTEFHLTKGQGLSAVEAADALAGAQGNREQIPFVH
jgi:hypothetical protein